MLVWAMVTRYFCRAPRGARGLKTQKLDNGNNRRNVALLAERVD